MRARKTLEATLLAVAIALCAAHGASAMTYVWWEGESAYEHNFDNKSFAAASLDSPNALSGGDWLNRGGPVPAEGVYARWHVEVPRRRQLLPLRAQVLESWPVPLALRPGRVADGREPGPH